MGSIEEELAALKELPVYDPGYVQAQSRAHNALPALIAEIEMLRDHVYCGDHHAGCSGAFGHPCKCGREAILRPDRGLGKP
jgi:hypothetical protein